MAASPAAQQAFDLQLIEAVRNPREQVQDENELTQAVDKLLKRGVDVNAADDYGYTALMIASRNGHAETVSALLSRLANSAESIESSRTSKLKQRSLGHSGIYSSWGVKKFNHYKFQPKKSQ